MIKKYPELVNLQEFKTNEEILEHFRKGGVIFCVNFFLGRPDSVEEKTVSGASLSTWKHPMFKNEPILVFANGNFLFKDEFQTQNRILFSSQERAQNFFQKAKELFEHDRELQSKFEKRHEHFCNLDDLFW